MPKSYESIIEPVQKYGLEWLRSKLLAVWLESYEAEIKTKIAEELRSKKNEFKKSKDKLEQERESEIYKVKSWRTKENFYSGSEFRNSRRDYGPIVGQGLSTYESLCEEERIKLDNIGKKYSQAIESLSRALPKEYILKYRYEEEYRAKFDKVIWSKEGAKVKDKCQEQINYLDLERVVQKFFQRHVWLKALFDRLEGKEIVVSFLKYFLKDQLIKLQQPTSFFELIQQLKTRPATKLSWKPVDDELLKKMIEGHPFFQPQDFYNVATHPNYPSLERTIKVKGPFSNYTFNRIDVLRFLMSNSGLGCEKKEDIIIPSFAPFHLDELEYFSPLQWSHFQSLFINIATENRPIWILLNKTGQKWLAYVDKDIEITPKIRQVFKKFHIGLESVDSSQNNDSNDIETLTPLTKWHAVLFGRVFQACRAGYDVKSYRSHVPVTLLLQAVLTSTVFNETRQAVNAAFVNRKPFTSLDVDEFNACDEDKTFPILLSSLHDLTGEGVEKILENFDKSAFKLSNEENTLTLDSRVATSSALIEALQIVYHSNVSRLVFSNIESNDLIRKLFNYDTSLKEIKPFDNTNKLKNYSYPLQCAARNRFLASYAPNCLQSANGDLKKRKTLWQDTGLEITRFFKAHGAGMDLDFNTTVSAFNKNWRNQYCDETSKSELIASAWSFIQIAQMGLEGLDNFFMHIKHYYVLPWRPIDREIAPDLSCTFDLNGSLSDIPSVYIDELTYKINSLDAKKNACSPLFKTLSFIMPDSLATETQTAFIKLLNELDNRKKNLPKELDEVILYDLKIEAKTTKELLRVLNKMADEGFQVLVRIPEWDRAAYENIQLRQLKAQYHQIQNKIRNNQRQLRQRLLKDNTQHIHDYEQGVLIPDVIIEDKLAQKEQPWGDKNTFYPLATQVPGIQQQLQQEVTQEFQQEEQQEQEQEQEQEQVQEITQFNGDESSLISRDNIEAKCKKNWLNVSPEIQATSGWVKKELSQLFSLWVGSKENAPHVIEKIHPHAIQEIMNNATQFRLGISKDNVPAGFYLSYLKKNKGLVLCFDEKRQKQEIIAQAAVPLKKRNPFTVHFHQAKIATEFRGDFRQLTLFSIEPEPNQDALTLWKYLALEDKDSQRLDNAKQTLTKLGVQIDAENVSVTAQYFDLALSNTPLAIGDFNHCLLLLKKWASAHTAISTPFINDLFDEKSARHLTEKNLKAFGQLFNVYDIDKQQHKNQGSVHFLVLADQLYQTFGSDHFDIWKKRFLDNSLNWSELLEKAEIDAYSLSMATLKDKDKDLHAIWWKLVDAHGAATGHMRYADLWYAFQKIIQFVEENDLTINKRALFCYLEVCKDFHGQVFLDRLYQVLKKASAQIDAEKIQQAVFNNLDHIDWSHSGFYYANQYDNYAYWDKDTQLTAFKFSIAADEKSYRIKWDSTHRVESAYLQALRYASQRIALNFSEFDKFKSLILAGLTSLSDSPNLVEIARLYVATVALGIDNLESYSIEEIKAIFADLNSIASSFLNGINRKIFLDDATLLPGTLKIRFAHIPFFLNTIIEKGLCPSLFKLSPALSIAFINNGGRAIECYQGDKEKFAKLIQFVLSKNGKVLEKQLFDPLITDYPWLLDVFIEQNKASFEITDLVVEDRRGAYQLSVLQQQLRSIDFSQTNYLPTYDELKKAYKQIVKHPNPIEKRREIIDQWLTKGCAITYQDADFRLLKDNEYLKFRQSLANNFNNSYKEQNLALLNALRGYLAVESDTNGTAQMDALATLFIRLDNKKYYNEVGQLIGLLLQKAKGVDKLQYYSVPQLTAWLHCFIDETNITHRHYPVNLLDEVLMRAVENSESSLLNPNLNKLKAKCESEQQRLMTEVAQNLLPNRYKPVLIKLILQARSDHAYVKEAEKILLKLHDAEVSYRWLNATSQLIESIANKSPVLRSTIISQLTKTSDQVFVLIDKENKVLRSLWEKSQIAVINLIQKEPKIENSLAYYTANPYIQMILTQSVSDWLKEASTISTVIKALNNFKQSDLKLLAEYYASAPNPSVSLLLSLIRNHKSAEAIIYHYEAVEQAKTADGSAKRHYSVTATDEKDLNRVLQGLKRKGQSSLSEIEQKQLINLFYYINSYCQVTKLESLSMRDLQVNLKKSLQEIKSALLSEGKHQASARLLGCMREILLRKSGKWVNHTQMLDLLYAALYNSESLLHQVRTGQGKSIITLMRASYLALTGFVVDVFSAKESLSKRDHEDFAPVLDAMCIEHAYITENDSANTYKTRSQVKGVGAINYATLGNFSLFHSRHTWQGETAIDLDKAKRVAFLDESDHVLLDEKTQFNYSDSRDSDAVYNLDEWVYRVAYDFYLQRKDNFRSDDIGNLYLSQNEDLQPLCKLLQERINQSPKQSTFFQKYIIPALDKQPEAIEKRDQKLKQLLVAAHTAYGLKEGVHFCIRPESKVIMDNLFIKTRFAKVVINNQIRPGSTYSDLVQQFLHIRLNKKAVNSEEIPNFFVEPCTEIALSQNAGYVLKKYYSKLEGCTGTAGNEVDLRRYEKLYGITHVVKLPSHEVTRTVFLPTEFCQSEHDQIEKLVDNILNYKQQPLLITCEDDIAVKKLAKKIQDKLKVLEPGYEFNSFIIDTNDSGKAESEIVPYAGRNGAVTISSRLGRGTDIKPDSLDGLIVLRTYPTSPRVTKQEYGRQGRNGAAGRCQDIIDFDVIKKHYADFSRVDATRLAAIRNEQIRHLDNKLTKHTNTNSNKFAYLNDATQREYYIQMRSVVQLKEEIKQEKEKFLRNKEYLICSMTGDVMDVLRQCIGQDAATHSNLRDDWLDSRKEIEAIWNSRLKGQNSDNDEVYAKFFGLANACWQRLCSQYSSLNPFLTLDLTPNQTCKTASNKALKLQSLEKHVKHTLEVWEQKLVDDNFLAREDEIRALKKLCSHVKKMGLDYHQDKKEGDKDSSVTLNLLKDSINETLDKITRRIPKSVEEHPLSSHTSIEDHSSKGALLPWKKPLLGQRTAQEIERTKQEMDRQVTTTFYQQWLKGAEQYIFSVLDVSDERINVIYGVNYHYLNKLYQHLQLASGDQQRNVQLIFQQRKHRIELFKGLTEVVQNASAYSLSYNAWSELVDTLMHSNEQVADYIKAAKRFFKQHWLNKKTLSEHCVEDIEKNDALLQLSMDIIQTAFIENVSLSFIDNFTQAIHKHFWDEFRAVDSIRQLFATKPCITKLLMRHTNEADIAYFISLLRNLTGSPTNEIRLKQLLDYLEKNSGILETTPDLLRPLFRLILTQSADHNQLNFLPAPDCLSQLSSKLQADFWHFLSQRLPIIEAECEELIALLANYEENKHFIEHVFRPLINLPPHIPLSYINTQLQLTLGKNFFEDCTTNLVMLKHAGEAFNRFLYHKKQIASEKKYAEPLSTVDYKDYLTKFKKFTPEENRTFFELATEYPQTSALAQYGLISVFTEHLVNRDHLEKAFNLFKDISKLPSNQSQVLDVVCIQLMRSSSVKTIDDEITQMSNFITILKGFVHIDNEYTPLLFFKQWKKVGYDSTWLWCAFNGLKQIKDFSVKHPNIDFLGSYLADIQQEKSIAHYQPFFDFVNQDKNADLDDKLLENLFSAYFIDKSIHSPADLAQHAQVLREIKRFNDHFKLDMQYQFQIDSASSDAAQYYLQFFEISKQYESRGLSNSALVLLLNAYFVSKKITHVEVLSQAFTVLCSINQLLKQQKCIATYRGVNFLERYLEDIQQGITIEHYQQFFDFFKKGKNSDLIDNFPTLFSAYFIDKSIKTPSELTQHARVWREIKRFKDDFKLDMQHLFKMDMTSSDAVKRYLQFFEVCKQYETSEYPTRAIKTLLFAYLKDKKITRVEVLSQAFRVLCDANQLQKNKNYTDYFFNFSGENQRKRQLIMQYLHHDLLDLGDEFKQQCWASYQNLMQRVLALPKKIATDKASRATLHTCFQHVISATRELAAIAKSPGSSANKVNHAFIPRQDLAKHQYFIISLHSRYRNYWFTNNLRKKQASHLFSQLEDLTNRSAMPCSIAKYYENCFAQIWQTQQSILISDKLTTHNKKGYSRLYDITVHLFLTLARDCLTAKAVGLSTKNELNNLLQKQLIFQINMLRERLSTYPKLEVLATKIPELEEWHPGSLELKTLNQFINDQYDTIPKHLRYLLDNINNLTQLTDTESLQKSNTHQMSFTRGV